MFPPTPGIVERERLLDLMGTPALAGVTLVTAPAGYGKSTLAHQWVAHHPNFGCGWYQIQVEHNAHATFLHHLWLAIDHATGVPEDRPTGVSVDLLLERLRRRSTPIMLVLDDYHVIENELIHQSVELLFRDLPNDVHIMLLSRQIPELSLARLQAYGQVRQLTQDDLAFTVDEVKRVFAHHALDENFLARLTEHAEGWIAGLQLALMAIDLDCRQASTHIDQLIVSISSNRLLNDYIAEEVLNALPDELRRFVLDTSVLTKLDPALCDAVLRIDTSAALLDQLEDNIVFVSRPGGIGTPLTYHRLFAECVQRLRRHSAGELSVDVLRLRAAQWHRDRGAFEEAAEYALAAEAWSLAADLLREFLPKSFSHINSWDSYYWLNRLPETYLIEDPALFQTYLTVLLWSGQFDRARPLLEMTAPELGREPYEQGWRANHLALLAQADGNRGDALYQGYRALALLPPQYAGGRLLAWAVIFREECGRGNRKVARLALRQAEIARKRQPRESLYWHFMVAPDIANDAATRGDLVGSEALTNHFPDELPTHFRSSITRVKIRLLSIYLEQGRLDLAATTANAIRNNLQEHRYRRWHAEAAAVLARYYLAIDEPERAWDVLNRSLESIRHYGGHALIRKTEASIAHYWLQTGQYQLAQLWSTRTELEPYVAREFGEIEPRTLRIRLLLLQEQLPDARELAAQSLALARDQGNVAAEIEFLVWSSVVARACGESDEADDALKQALELGTPGRFAGVYKSTGIDLSDAIRAVLPALSEDARCHAISMVGDSGSTGQPDDASPWIEAGLTQREREVLAELVLGKSNREISDAIYISERTVKKHLANLFRKTGASNRMAAALWGRDRMPETSPPLGQRAP